MKWTREEEDDGHVEFEIPVYRLRVQRQLFGWRCRFGRFFVYGVTEAAGNENGGVEEKPYYFTFLKKQTLSYLNYHKNLDATVFVPMGLSIMQRGRHGTGNAR